MIHKVVVCMIKLSLTFYLRTEEEIMEFLEGFEGTQFSDWQSPVFDALDNDVANIICNVAKRKLYKIENIFIHSFFFPKPRKLS